MWKKTRETRLELRFETGESQVIHHLVFHYQIDEISTLRLNIHAINDKKCALVHLHNDIRSQLLFKADSTETLDDFVCRMKAKSDQLADKPKSSRQTIINSNWIWQLTDSELTEFGIEESWVVRWRNKTNPRLRAIQLQVNWFKGNLNAIPSFASVEVVRKEANNLIELNYIEMPVDSNIPVLQALETIEQKVEDLLVTAMDRLHQRLIQP